MFQFLRGKVNILERIRKIFKEVGYDRQEKGKSWYENVRFLNLC